MSRSQICFHGDFLVYSSLSQINFYLGKELLDRGYPVSFYQHPDRKEQNFSEEANRLRAHQADPDAFFDLTIFHQYPLRLENATHHGVAIVPWEYSSIPKEWKRKLTNSDVEELWVPSSFVKSILSPYFDPKRIFVIPNGFDPKYFHSEGDFYPFSTQKKFRFLFVGGTLARKGIDCLLKAYTEEFSADEDVSLIIKDFFYAKKENLIQSYQTSSHPEIIYHYENADFHTIASMYRSAHCLVHPFRAEGFGMPILEAMASELPVIATGYGPVLDFTTPNLIYSLPYQLEPARGEGFLQHCVEPPVWAEPDLSALKKTMRHVFTHYQEAKDKAKDAYQHAHSHYSWAHIADQVEQRIQTIYQLPERLTESKQLILYNTDTISLKEKEKASRLLKKNNSFSYHLLVEHPFLQFHHSFRRELRILDPSQTETKNVNIFLISSTPVIPNEKEWLRGMMTDKNNQLFYLLDLIAHYIETKRYSLANKYIESISNIDVDSALYLQPFYTGVLLEKKELFMDAADSFQQYLSLSLYDDFVFRKNYAQKRVDFYIGNKI